MREHHTLDILFLPKMWRIGATFEILAVVTMSQSNCLGGDVSHSGEQLLTGWVSTPLHVYFVYVCECAHCLVLSALQCVRHISIEHTLGYFAHTHHASVTVTYISTIMNHESYHYVSQVTWHVYGAGGWATAVGGLHHHCKVQLSQNIKIFI